MEKRIIPVCMAIFIVFNFVEAEEDEYAAAVRDKLQQCVACHGVSGASTQSQYPILAGQHQYYLYVQLKDFKAGRRADPIMAPLVATLEKEEMQALAKYFSEQQWPPISYKADEGQVKLGLKVVNSGQCVACHLSGFEGNSRVPRLAGQHPAYLVKTMLDFKNKTRKNAPDKSSLFDTFSEEEIKAVAEYAASLSSSKVAHAD